MAETTCPRSGECQRGVHEGACRRSDGSFFVPAPPSETPPTYGVGKTAASALTWALDLMEMYEARLIHFGDPAHLVNSAVHVAGKALARKLAAEASGPHAVMVSTDVLDALRAEAASEKARADAAEALLTEARAWGEEQRRQASEQYERAEAERAAREQAERERDELQARVVDLERGYDVSRRALGLEPCEMLLEGAQRKIRAAEAERDALRAAKEEAEQRVRFYEECAKAPLMATVMRQRDAAEADLARTREALRGAVELIEQTEWLALSIADRKKLEAARAALAARGGKGTRRG